MTRRLKEAKLYLDIGWPRLVVESHGEFYHVRLDEDMYRCWDICLSKITGKDLEVISEISRCKDDE